MKRRGSVYLLVLLTSAFVLASGLAALSIEERSHKRADLSGEIGSARIALRSGLDLALQHMEEHPTWRSGVGGNDRLIDTVINTGGWDHTVRVFTVDPDENLAENTTDPFMLTVRSSRGRSSRRMNVTVQPTSIPMDVLEMGAYTMGALVTETSAIINGAAPVGSWLSSTGSGSIIYVPFETGGTASAITYWGQVVESAAMRELPPLDLVGMYGSRGVLVAEAELTSFRKDYVIENVTIGPSINPFGFGQTSPIGVYVIDQGTTDVIIRDSGINATLVFVGTGQVILEGNLIWTTVTAGEPALLANAPILFRTATNVSKTSNFTTSSSITGIVHTQSTVTLESGAATIDGTLICMDTLTIGSQATLTLLSSREALDHPPEGFESALGLQMSVVEWLEP